MTSFFKTKYLTWK